MNRNEVFYGRFFSTCGAINSGTEENEISTTTAFSSKKRRHSVEAPRKSTWRDRLYHNLQGVEEQETCLKKDVIENLRHGKTLTQLRNQLEMLLSEPKVEDCMDVDSDNEEKQEETIMVNKRCRRKQVAIAPSESRKAKDINVIDVVSQKKSRKSLARRITAKIGVRSN